MLEQETPSEQVIQNQKDLYVYRLRKSILHNDLLEMLGKFAKDIRIIRNLGWEQ